MLDPAHLARITVDSRDRVFDDGTILPRSLPNLVCKVQVLVGSCVTLIVRDLLLKPVGAGRAVKKRGYNVPTDTALGKMIEGRKLPS